MARAISAKGQELTKQAAPKVNEDITAEKVLLIGPEGEQIGVIPVGQALSIAREADLDLVVVGDGSPVPVCKVLDYGKYKYETHRKKAESRKKQKTVELKEVQIRPSISEHDLSVKCRAISKFIEAGKRVKLVLRYRGRELSHKEVGQMVMTKILEYCQEFAKEETPPKLEGSAMIAILAKK